ncbi:hypothetical protein V1517DRAFT_376584 [Lipomyces orientalis]|uniref:Uncharacterized protein n=1 Tax=Lipomyces orientalis TaxID=1233043 RepID=A0ACC3TE15_9ASCO
MLSMAKFSKVAAMLAMFGLSLSESNITDDTYFYGQSEPVYPSPIGTGNGDWEVAYGRAAALVAQMTVEEKHNLTYGVPSPNGCGVLTADFTSESLLPVGMPYNLSEPHVAVNALDPAAKPVIFDSAVEGHILVKNVKNALPLKAARMISVFGYDAKLPDQNMPDTAPVSPWVVGWPTPNDPPPKP